MSHFREIIRRQQAAEREAARLRRVLKERYGFTPESVQQTMYDILIKRFSPDRPKRPTINGRPALKGELY